MRLHLIHTLLCLLIATVGNFASAEVKVQVQKGHLKDFIGKDAFEKDFYEIVKINTIYIPITIQEQEELLKSQLIPDVNLCAIKHQVLSSRCIDFVSPDLQKRLLDEGVKVIEKLGMDFKVAHPTIDLKKNKAELEKSFIYNAITKNVSFTSNLVQAEELLQPFVSDNLFKLPKVLSNCGFATISAILKTAGKERIVPVDDIYKIMVSENITPRSPTETIQFGDVIFFWVPMDYHIMVYVGTDETTGQWVVYHKDGYMPSHYTMTYFDDVIKKYMRTQESITAITIFKQNKE